MRLERRASTGFHDFDLTNHVARAGDELAVLQLNRIDADTVHPVIEVIGR